tara:strand:+ start:21 stop:1160 length:1140 start_codon:yes stop_codon:yes gene_type:complete
MIEKMKYSRVVVKLGTNLLTGETDSLKEEVVASLVSQIASLRSNNLDILIVSSGAIAAGRGLLGQKNKTKSLKILQAQAAVGQNYLMQMYGKLFAEHGIIVGQALLTRAELSSNATASNARSTLEELFGLGVVPIVNENDVVATDEIEESFGDNDNLSAAVANLIAADLLVFLTDQQGLFDSDPRSNPQAKLIKRVTRVNDEIIKGANNIAGSRGKGGMASKVLAATEATSWGTATIIASGNEQDVLSKIVRGDEVGTFFEPWGKTRSRARRRSLGSVFVKGKIIVDDGAAKALMTGKSSLLAIGVTDVQGSFESGDVVEIFSPDNLPIARGAVAYPSEAVNLFKGHRSESIRDLISSPNFEGRFVGDEIVHVDNMVLI